MDDFIEYEVWLGDLEGYLRSQAALREGVNPTIPLSAYADNDDDAEPLSRLLSIEGSVGIISIKGDLVSGGNPYINRYLGLVSYPEIKNAVIDAVNHKDVSKIMLDIDSPGGAVNGISEFTSFLRDVNANHKPIYSHSSGMMLSAAYWIGSVGTQISASELSSIGSIGAIAVHKEMTGLLDKAGVKVTVLRSGENKALISPYEKLSDKARNHVQSRLEKAHVAFIRDVAQNRRTSEAEIRESAGDGRDMFGAEALKIGLVDKISTLDQVVNKLISMDNNTNNQRQSLGVHSMPKLKQKVLTAAGKAAIASGLSEEEALKQFGEEEVQTSVEAESAEPAAKETHAAQKEEPKAELTAPAAATVLAQVPVQAQAQAPAAQFDFSALVSKISDQASEIGQLKADLAQANQKVAGLETTMGSLTEISTTALQRMQIALGQPATDTKGMTAQAIVDLHTKTEAAFNNRFHVGSKAAPHQGDEPVARNKGALAAAAAEVVNFRK